MCSIIKNYLIIICIGILVASCISQPSNNSVNVNFKLPKNSTIIADSIIYEVTIRDIEKVDPWDSIRLKSFRQDIFIDHLFDQIYNGELVPFDHYTGEKLSTNDVKKIEESEGFSRLKVSKVQFNELWYYDSLGVLNKKVNYMTLGIESYSNQGTYTGHKALFKLVPTNVQ